MKKTLKILVIAPAAILLAALPALAAGTLEPAAGPENTSAYTLQDVYDRLATGSAGEATPFAEPTSGPAAGMPTVGEIMSVAPAADNLNGVRPEEVPAGKTFWGLRSDGTWGLQTGTRHVASIECEPHWAGSDCDTCAVGWAGVTCDACAEHFTGADCDTCADSWAGANCDTCAVGWMGPDCDTCGDHWTGAKCDLCAEGWGGLNCDRCAWGWTGPNCDISLGYTARINDTGITKWANANSNSLTSPQADYPGQDADYGTNGFSFTKLDAAGNPLTESAATWTCVLDNVTGLTWEVKTDDGGLHDKDNTYTWYNSDPTTNGGSAGTATTGTCIGPSGCDTEKYAAAVNDEGLCGFTDWRLPTREELLSIVDFGTTHPAIDTVYFPNTPSSDFWSGSPYAGNSDFAVRVNFGYGRGLNGNKVDGKYVRLVRGGQ